MSLVLQMVKVLKMAGAKPEVLLLYTDGGPDHNVKFVTVRLGLIAIFIACDLDFLVAARTCPQQSWRNCVEKIMSILNLAMYGVALVRDELQPSDIPGTTEKQDNEALCKAAGGSMAALRKAAQGNVNFKVACMEALMSHASAHSAGCAL